MAGTCKAMPDLGRIYIAFDGLKMKNVQPSWIIAQYGTILWINTQSQARIIAPRCGT